MEKLSKVGSVLLFYGCASFLLSLFNLQFKAFSFLGESKVYVEIASIVIGLILVLLSNLSKKNKDNDETVE